MKKLEKFGLIILLVIGLNACGETENDESKIASETSFNFEEMPNKFSMTVKNFSYNYFKYFLESPKKEILFSENVDKKTKSTVICEQYSNENFLVTYDCIITSDKNKSEQRKESIIIEKGKKYNFYTTNKKENSEDMNLISAGEIFISKD